MNFFISLVISSYALPLVQSAIDQTINTLFVAYLFLRSIWEMLAVQRGQPFLVMDVLRERPLSLLSLPTTTDRRLDISTELRVSTNQLVQKSQIGLLRDTVTRLEDLVEQVGRERMARPSTALLLARNRYFSSLQAIGNRSGGRQVQLVLRGLAKPVRLVGEIIRMQKGHTVVTEEMQAHVLEMVITQATSCQNALKNALNEGIWPAATACDYSCNLDIFESRRKCDPSSTLTLCPSISTCRGRKTESERTKRFVPVLSSSGKKGKRPFSPYRDRQLEHQPRNASVSAGVAYVERRHPGFAVNPRGTSLQGSGSLCV